MVGQETWGDTDAPRASANDIVCPGDAAACGRCEKEQVGPCRHTARMACNCKLLTKRVRRLETHPKAHISISWDVAFLHNCAISRECQTERLVGCSKVQWMRRRQAAAVKRAATRTRQSRGCRRRFSTPTPLGGRIHINDGSHFSMISAAVRSIKVAAVDIITTLWPLRTISEANARSSTNTIMIVERREGV